MANVSTSTVIAVWSEGNTNGKRRKCVIADLSGTFTAGGSTNKILATAFGLTKIESCSNGVLDDNSLIYILAPSNDGSYLMVTRVQEATGVPLDITVTSPRKLRVEVAGY